MYSDKLNPKYLSGLLDETLVVEIDNLNKTDSNRNKKSNNKNINVIIKSSKHDILKDTNTGKLKALSEFIKEYRMVASLILDDIWNNGYKWTVDGVDQEFNVSKNLLILPKYLDYNVFLNKTNNITDNICNHIKIETKLSARAMSSLVTQLIAVLKSSVEKQRKRLWMLEKVKSEGGTLSLKLIDKINKELPVKPNVSRLNPELSSKCVDFIYTSSLNNNGSDSNYTLNSDKSNKLNKYFNGFLKLKSIGKDFGQICIPIKFHKHSNSLMSKSYKLKNSFLIKDESIDIRWEKEVPKRITGDIVGADQGFKDVLNLSNGVVTPKENKDGYSLEKILRVMSRKKKGSKAFKKSQDHRNNFINWSINKIGVGLKSSDIKKINLEKIWNIRYKKKSSRVMSHWTHAEIERKILSKGTELGIEVQMQDSTYRSQRCSSCGLVLKSNRKEKEYCCKVCGFIEDADYNASCNHEIELPEITYEIKKLRLNLKGFYWKQEGVFNLNGEEFRVPLDPTIKDIDVI